MQQPHGRRACAHTAFQRQPLSLLSLAPPPLQGAAGTLFFWSYMLLVFMVLLNFLLAIIVDAFSEVKGDTAEKVGLHTELARLAAAKWRALVGRLGRGHISDRRLGLLLRSWAGEGAGAGEGEEREGEGGGEGREKTVKVG